MTAAVVREAAGDYSLVVRPDRAGNWRFAVAGTASDGTALSAAEGNFEVASPQARE